MYEHKDLEEKKNILNEIKEIDLMFKTRRQRQMKEKELETEVKNVKTEQNIKTEQSDEFMNFVKELKNFDFNLGLKYVETIKEKIEKEEYISVEEYLKLLSLNKKLKEKGLLTHFIHSDKIYINWDIRHKSIDKLVFKYFSLLLEGKEIDLEAKENEKFKLLKEIVDEDVDNLLKRDCELFWVCYNHPLGYAFLNALGKRNSYKEFKAIYDFLTKLGEDVDIEKKDSIRKELSFIKSEILEEVDRIKEEIKDLKSEIREIKEKEEVRELKFSEFDEESNLIEKVNEIETKFRNLESRLEILESKEKEEDSLFNDFEEREDIEDKLKEIELKLREIELKLEEREIESERDYEQVDFSFEEKLREIKDRYDQKILDLEEEINKLKSQLESSFEKEKNEIKDFEKEKEEDEEEEKLSAIEEEKEVKKEKGTEKKGILDKFHSLPPLIKYIIYFVAGLLLFLLVYYGL